MKKSYLMNEARICKHLQGGPGIPRFYWAGEEGNQIIMITQLLGPTLDDLYLACKRRYSFNTVLVLGERIVTLTCIIAYTIGILP